MVAVYVGDENGVDFLQPQPIFHPRRLPRQESCVRRGRCRKSIKSGMPAVGQQHCEVHPIIRPAEFIEVRCDLPQMRNRRRPRRIVLVAIIECLDVVTADIKRRQAPQLFDVLAELPSRIANLGAVGGEQHRRIVSSYLRGTFGQLIDAGRKTVVPLGVEPGVHAGPVAHQIARKVRQPLAAALQ